MATDIWFPFYIGDYLKDANHLTQGEHGAYLALLIYYYGKGKPIPASKCYAIAYAHDEQERCNVDAVLSEFFVQQGGVWVNKRADRELAKRVDLAEKRQNAANIRWKKADASALHLDTQPPSQSHPQPPIQKQAQKEPDLDKGGVGETQNSEKGFLNSNKEGVVSGWDVRNAISLPTMDIAMNLSKEWGWDFDVLCGLYNQWVTKNGFPKSVEKAFIPWMRRFTNEAPPQ